MADADEAHATGHAPPGHGFRRSRTVDEAANLRRRPTFMPSARSSFTEGPMRRDSSFSDFSLNLNGSGDKQSEDGLWNLGKMASSPPAPISTATVPLILALLPAVGGLFFEGGSAFFTDVILLGLAAIVLRWSVTQPWNWYHAAQEARVAKELAISTPVFEGDSDLELSTQASATTALEDVPEEGDDNSEGDQTPDDPSSYRKWRKDRDVAAQALRRHEKFALAWCFLFPLLAAYLLHTIRGQLSRRSEGLVSEYNLHIFTIAAEIRPVSHLIRLLQNSTLHKQRIVATNPYEQQEKRDERFQDLYAKIEELESRLSAREATTANNAEQEQTAMKSVETLVMRNYRDKVQPEVESVTRAMRRYEKKLSNIIDQIDIRLEYLDQRSNDAIALAAIAARQKNNQGGLIGWMFEQTTAIILLPVQAAIAVVTFPFKTISSLLGRASRTSPERTQKKGRRTPGSRGGGSERIPTRVSRK
ncbi:hypothetical protein LQW54_009841 [Pestalotiopsis sp. IQ-011]